MSFKDNKLTIFLATATVLSIIVVSASFITEIQSANKKNVIKESPNTTKKIENKIDKVSFVGVGDNLIHDSIYNCADRRAGKFGDGEYDFSKLYEQIKPEIEPYDIRYINQESVIAGNQYGISAYPRFNAPMALMPAVINSGFNLISMANNHALDKGSKALVDSINLWNRTGITHVGTYASQEDRDKPLIIEKNNIKIGVLSYTYDTNGFRPEKPYMVSYLTEKMFVMI